MNQPRQCCLTCMQASKCYFWLPKGVFLLAAAMQLTLATKQHFWVLPTLSGRGLRPLKAFPSSNAVSSPCHAAASAAGNASAETKASKVALPCTHQDLHSKAMQHVHPT